LGFHTEVDYGASSYTYARRETKRRLVEEGWRTPSWRVVAVCCIFL